MNCNANANFSVPNKLSFRVFIEKYYNCIEHLSSLLLGLRAVKPVALKSNVTIIFFDRDSSCNNSKFSFCTTR